MHKRKIVVCTSENIVERETVERKNCENHSTLVLCCLVLKIWSTYLLLDDISITGGVVLVPPLSFSLLSFSFFCSFSFCFRFELPRFNMLFILKLRDADFSSNFLVDDDLRFFFFFASSSTNRDRELAVRCKGTSWSINMLELLFNFVDEDGDISCSGGSLIETTDLRGSFCNCDSLDSWLM